MAPGLTCYAAVTLNGCIAAHSQESTSARLDAGVTSQADQNFLKMRLKEHRYVFMGYRSLLPERGLLRCYAKDEAHLEPLWVLFTRSQVPQDISHAILQRQLDIPVLFYAVEGGFLPFVKASHAGTQPKWEWAEDSVEPVHPQEFLPGRYFAKGTLGALRSYLNKRCVVKQHAPCQGGALLGGGELNSLFWQTGLIEKWVLTWSSVWVSGENIVPVFKSTFDSEIKLSRVYYVDHHVVVEYLSKRSPS